jgi:hypothetical protein
MSIKWGRHERASRVAPVAATLVILAAVAMLLQSVTSSEALAASPVTQTYKPTGTVDVFTVPAGVTAVQVKVRGGAGGSMARAIFRMAEAGLPRMASSTPAATAVWGISAAVVAVVGAASPGSEVERAAPAV